MNKLRHFLTSIEEKIMLRYGRRIWQMIAFLAMIVFVISLLFILINLLPTSRKEVHISKREYNKNQIDYDFDESNDVDACNLADYKKAVDSLKSQMPNSEWVQLFTKERVQRYKEVNRYDPWYGSYSTYVPYYVEEEVENRDAIPNILKGIYESKGIDSAAYCEQISIVRVLTVLMKQTQKDVATRALKEYYRGLVSYNYIDRKGVERAISTYSGVNGKKPFVVNPDDSKDPYHLLSSYIRVYSNDTLTDKRDELAIDASKKLKTKKIKDLELRNSFALWVLKNEMDDAATEMCLNDLFTKNTFKYNEENFKENVDKYLGLYLEKYRLAEQLKFEEEMEKEENVEFYSSSGLASFGSILAIASILILYSIRQIIKDKKE